MRKRTKAWRLQQERRVINKRVEITKSWGQEEEQPHRLHKFNLNCGCKMCHYYKHAGNGKARYKHSDNKKLIN